MARIKAIETITVHDLNKPVLPYQCAMLQIILASVPGLRAGRKCHSILNSQDNKEGDIFERSTRGFS